VGCNWQGGTVCLARVFKEYSRELLLVTRIQRGENGHLAQALHLVDVLVATVVTLSGKALRSRHTIPA
jgi:hypothetical protein